MNSNFFRVALAIIIVTVSTGYFACVTNPDAKPSTTSSFAAHSVFVLNEGGYGKNNSTLDCYEPDASVYQGDIFQSVNGRGLGDTGNDLVDAGGDSLYIVVSQSDSIRLINRITGLLLRTYPMPHGSAPAKMAIVNDSIAAVTGQNSNSVYFLNLVTGRIDNIVSVDANPRGIAKAGALLCVCCSDYSGKTNKIDIISTVTAAVVNTLDAAPDPTSVQVFSDNVVAAVCGGSYGVPNTSALVIFNPLSANAVSKILLPGFPEKMARDGDQIYIPCDATVLRFNVNTPAVRDTFVTNVTAYGITVDPATHVVYLADGKDNVQRGELYYYGADKTLLGHSPTGVSPGTMLAVH